MVNGDKVRTAIVLQGGGALGAYECGVLEALYQARGKDFTPEVITGISIGAVNAAILAGAGIEALGEAWRTRFALLEAVPHSPYTHVPPVPVYGQLIPPGQLLPPFLKQYLAVQGVMLAPLPPLLQPVLGQLIPQFTQQRLSAFGNESMYRLRPEYLYAGPMASLFTDSFYDTTPLRETLQQVVDLDRLNRYCQVAVTAVNVATGQLANFGNKKGLDVAIKAGKEGQFTNHESLAIDHILASGSLPPSFPATWVDGSSYWDGGLFSNTPLSVAINCLERCCGDDSVEREVIVVELFPREGSVPNSIPEVINRIFNLTFSSKLTLDKKLFQQTNDYIELAGHIEELVEMLENLDATHRQDPQLRDIVSLVDGIIKNHRGYRNLIDHNKIDYFTLIPFTAGSANAADFSKATIEARIKAGHQEAERQGIAEPKLVHS
ncbi:MAG: patatin-like phospholipase family protein [Planctomycetaceae bacterium]|nr:patatin-like phospholipase family protein [Planctomycetaceae bacterium]